MIEILCTSTFRFITLYLVLPETENRTLEEIEQYFSDKSRKFGDRKIKKITPTVNASQSNDIELNSMLLE